MVMVALSGPPFVSTKDSSNNCRVPIVEVMLTNRMMDFTMGMVIRKNFCKKEAPSISADS